MKIRHPIPAVFSALFFLAGCSSDGERPQDGFNRIVSSLGIEIFRSAGHRFDVDGLTVEGLSGNLSHPFGWTVTADRARGTFIERVAGYWGSLALEATNVRVSPGGETDRPRAVFAVASFDRPRSARAAPNWRSFEGKGVAFLNGDGGARVTASTLTLSWSEIDGDLIGNASLENVVPRPSWLSSLGFSTCIVAALQAAAPIQVRLSVRHSATTGKLTVEQASLAGARGMLDVTATFSGLRGRDLGALLDVLANPELVTPDVNLVSFRADFRDAGATGACVETAVGSDASRPGGIEAQVAGHPWLADEDDREELVRGLAAYARSPGPASVVLVPNDPVQVRLFPSVLASPFRNKYVDLAVHAGGRVFPRPDPGTPVAASFVDPERTEPSP